jgi:hypothetical protein
MLLHVLRSRSILLAMIFGLPNVALSWNAASSTAELVPLEGLLFFAGPGVRTSSATASQPSLLLRSTGTPL